MRADLVRFTVAPCSTSELSLVVGVLDVAFGLLRMGFVARFFAKPVLCGFIIGLGIVIAVGQLHKIVGVSQGSGDTVRQLAHFFAEFGGWHRPTVAVDVSALAILFALARFATTVRDESALQPATRPRSSPLSSLSRSPLSKTAPRSLSARSALVMRFALRNQRAIVTIL